MFQIGDFVRNKAYIVVRARTQSHLRTANIDEIFIITNVLEHKVWIGDVITLETIGWIAPFILKHV
jgi:hypothetical protein